jgi:RNA ligase
LFWTQESGFEVVTTYKTWGEGWDKIKNEISKSKEGYVIRFKNGFRMKIKGDEYVRLHKILTNISNRDIWEYLKDNKPFDELLEKVPDEFNEWVKETVRDFTIKFDNINKDYIEIYENLKSRNLNRKEFAIRAKEYRHSNILFNMLDGKEHKQNIWKIIYPTYSKPFKKDEN